MMVDTIATVAAWACFAFIVYATVVPIERRPALPKAINVGRLEHVGAFALFGGLFCAAYPQHLIMISLLTIGTAVLLELAQTFRPDRHGRISDALWKMTGGIVGVLVVHVFTSIAGP
jgi:VanZ family protein